MSQLTSELKEEHQVWLDQIRSWEREIGQLSVVNGEMVSKANSKESQSKIDQFENRFAIELGRLDSMKHNIKIRGGDVEQGKKEIEEFRHYFEALRDEFGRFQTSLS